MTIIKSWWLASCCSHIIEWCLVDVFTIWTDSWKIGHAHSSIGITDHIRLPDLHCHYIIWPNFSIDQINHSRDNEWTSSILYYKSCLCIFLSIGIDFCKVFDTILYSARLAKAHGISSILYRKKTCVMNGELSSWWQCSVLNPLAG